jgi:hypothetical protein
MKPEPLRQQDGSVMPLVLLLGLLGAVLGVGLLNASFEGQRQAHKAVADQQSYYAAMAGMEAALADIRVAPERYLVPGTTWTTATGSPRELDYLVTLSGGDTPGTYRLASKSGTTGRTAAILATIASQQSIDDLSRYALAVSDSLIFRRSNGSVLLQGAPIYVGGDLRVPFDPGQSVYPLSDGNNIAVGGEALILQAGKLRAATAAELGAASLLTRVVPVNVAGSIAALIEQAKQGGVPGAEAYNPEQWRRYAVPGRRLVYVDGDLDLSQQHGTVVLYGRLLVRGQVLMATNTALIVHGALHAGSYIPGPDEDVLQVYYAPGVIPGGEGNVQVVDWQVTP